MQDTIFAHCPKHNRQEFVLISKWFWCPKRGCGHSFEYEVAVRLHRAGALSSASSVSRDGAAPGFAGAAPGDTRDPERLRKERRQEREPEREPDGELERETGEVA